MALQDRGDQRRVEAAREEHADRHVRDHAIAESVDEHGLELLLELALGARQRLARLERRPVAACHRFADFAQLQPVPGQQLVHSPVDGARRRDVPELEVFAERVAVDLGAPRAESAQRLQFRAEPQRPAVPRVIQRLDAQAVADQPETALALLPQRDREHADEPVDRGDPPLAQRREHDLGVAAAAKAVAAPFELRSDLGEVVDLAVEHHDELAVVREHRLVAQSRQVEDRKPRVAEGDAPAGAHPRAAVVGAALTQALAPRPARSRNHASGSTSRAQYPVIPHMVR